MRKFVILAALIVVAGGAGVLIQVGGDVSNTKPAAIAKGLDLSALADTAPAQPIDLVFLFHSVGEQLLADRGSSDGQAARLTKHPNGGGLAALLARNNYRLHEATYGSKLGDDTDLFDWLPKFQYDMEAVLSTGRPYEPLPAGERNRVVMFKSSFSSSAFVGAGEGSGNPDGPDLTEANARATMKAVREELAKHPGVLFVYLTAPPLAPKTTQEPAWNWLVQKALGRLTSDDELRRSGELAGYPHRNIVVFDLFDALTGHGASNFSIYATGDGWDPHPSSEGNSKVAAELVPFLNRAVRYAGIAK
jgi:hypothetical protein